jgi:hypothetical protein
MIASYLLRIQDLGLDRLEHSFGSVPVADLPEGSFEVTITSGHLMAPIRADAL